MKKNEVKVGGTYLAKVTDKVVPVRLDGENAHGGWDATNLVTHKKVRIKSPAKLRGLAPGHQDKPHTKTTTLNAGGGILVDVVETNDAKAKAATRASDPDLVPINEALKPKGKKAGAKAATKPAAKDKAAKKLSCLDAAVQVLKEQGQPMACKAMVDAMFTRKLWHSDAPTPHATLYSAILREVVNKKDAARFKKVDRGQFTLNAGK